MSYQDDNRDGPPPLPPDRDADADRDTYADRYAEDRDRYAAPGLPPKQSGGCSKGCLYGAAGCGCVTMLVVIGLGVLGWQFARQSLSLDPAVVKTTAQEMADFQPPAGLDPKIKFDFFVAKMVIYASKDGASQLMLVQINKSIVGNDKRRQDDFERQFKNGMENPQGGNKRELEIVKSEQREMKIRGGKTKITFAEAKDADDGKKFRLIKGGFEGKGGPVEFQLQLPEEKYKEEDVVKFLEGIK